jgi:hypothetical protein
MGSSSISSNTAAAMLATSSILLHRFWPSSTPSATDGAPLAAYALLLAACGAVHHLITNPSSAPASPLTAPEWTPTHVFVDWRNLLCGARDTLAASGDRSWGELNISAMVLRIKYEARARCAAAGVAPPRFRRVVVCGSVLGAGAGANTVTGLIVSACRTHLDVDPVVSMQQLEPGQREHAVDDRLAGAVIKATKRLSTDHGMVFIVSGDGNVNEDEAFLSVMDVVQITLAETRGWLVGQMSWRVNRRQDYREMARREPRFFSVDLDEQDLQELLTTRPRLPSRGYDSPPVSPSAPVGVLVSPVAVEAAVAAATETETGEEATVVPVAAASPVDAVDDDGFQVVTRNHHRAHHTPTPAVAVTTPVVRRCHAYQKTGRCNRTSFCEFAHTFSAPLVRVTRCEAWMQHRCNLDQQQHANSCCYIHDIDAPRGVSYS